MCTEEVKSTYWTGRPQFVDEFMKLLASDPQVQVPVQVSNEIKYMPQGYCYPQEARLETFGPKCYPMKQEWSDLKNWWLLHKKGANTPNWDIAMSCEIDHRPGLVLVEAKAHSNELETRGKPLDNTSANSVENHERIGKAIKEACIGWQCIDNQVNISRDSHYQLANRLAFTWMLAKLGFPVVLLYLGFTGDKGIEDLGTPFSDDSDWQNAFAQYVTGTIPIDLFGKRHEFNNVPVWLLSRSRPVIGVSPPPRPKKSL
jgi:hypothetical protein